MTKARPEQDQNTGDAERQETNKVEKITGGRGGEGACIRVRIRIRVRLLVG